MTNRQFYQSLGICPECRKEKLFGDEKECLECRVKKYISVRKYRKEHPRYDADKRLILYRQRSNDHQCTYCGLPLDDDYQFKMCTKCRRKSNMQLQAYRKRKRLENGI